MEQNTSKQMEDEISLKEIILAIAKHKVLILCLVCISTLLAAVFSFSLVGKSQEAKLIISLNFESIKESKNPDQTAFDPYQISSVSILTNVLETLQLDNRLTANQIRPLVDFEPLVPEEVKQMRAFSLEKEGESKPFYPNEFVLTVKSNRALGIDGAVAAKIANQIVESYIDYFGETYAEALPIPNQLTAFESASYDYSDVSQVYHQQMNGLTKYIGKLSLVDPSFRSMHTGFSFVEILETVSIIDEVELNRMDSLISSYKLTKDPTRLAIYYQYMIDRLELERNKNAAETSTSKETLKTIDNSSNKALDALTGNATVTEDKVSYFNDLILKTAEVGTTAAELTQDISFYQNELKDLQAGKIKAGEGRVLAEENVKQLSVQIKENMIKWIEIANNTALEFYDKKMSNAIMPLSPAEITSSVKLPLNIAIGMILGLMAGIFIALFVEYWKHAE